MAVIRSKIFSALIATLFALGSIALIRDTVYNGHDFKVFWKAAGYLLHGESAYSLSRDGGMVFKYPPWVLPFFFPFAFLPLEAAKWIWGGIQVASLAAVIAWIVRRARCPWTRLVPVVLAFWGLWAVHAIDGQIALTLLALSLWCWRPDPLRQFNSASTALTLSLSTKIFTLFPLLYTLPRRDRLRSLILIAGVAGFLSIPALWATPGHQPWILLQDWFRAAGSGGDLLTLEHIRGRLNPGLPGFLLRALQVPPQQTWADLAAFAGFALVIGTAWLKASRRLPPEAQWCGWLGLVPVVHPLPWWHLFVFAFPLAALAWDRSWESPKKLPKFLILLGLILLTVATQKTLGATGRFLELQSAKSWGVLLCAWALLVSSPQTKTS